MSLWTVAALVVPLLCLGGVTGKTLLVAVVAVGVLAVRQERERGSARSGSRAVHAARLALWLHAAICALQLVPLPPAVLKFMSGGGFAIWSASDVEFGRGAMWHPTSLDPSETMFALATAVSVAIFFDVLSRGAARSEGRRAIVGSVALAVVIFCLIAILHPAFGVEKLYGLYAPVQPSGSLETKIVPSLLNPNHAAAVACVAPPLLIGLYSEASVRGMRLLFALGAAISGAVALLTLSRAGIGVLAIELVVMVAYGLWHQRTKGDRSVGAAVGGTLVAAGSAAGGLYLALPLLLREVRDVDVSKFQLARVAWRMSGEYPLVGIGRGAFASMSPAYQSSLLPSQFRYARVENWPMQLVVDLGFPAAILLILLISYAVFRSLRRCLSKPTTFGAAVALIGIGIHDLADFSCEYAATGMIAAALLAVVTSADPGRTRDAGEVSRSRAASAQFARITSSRGGRAVGVAVALAAVGFSFGRTLSDDVDGVSHAWASRGLDGLESQITAAAARHPAEPYFPLARGVQLLRTPEAGIHLARAEALAPWWALNHYWIAHWFVAHGRAPQGWAEFREANRLDPRMTDPILLAMIRLRASIDELIALTPDPDALEHAATQLSKVGRAEDAASLDDRILLWHPNAVGARVRVISRLAAAGNVTAARAAAHALLIASPNDPRVFVACAALEEDPLEAERVLRDGLSRVPGNVRLLQDLIERRGRRLGPEAVSEELSQLTQALSAQGGAAELPYVIVAEIELARKRPIAAVSAYLQAAAVATEPKALLVRAAELAESSGQLGVAETTWRRLADLHPQDSVYTDARARVQRAILTGSLPPGMGAVTP